MWKKAQVVEHNINVSTNKTTNCTAKAEKQPEGTGGCAYFSVLAKSDFRC